MALLWTKVGYNIQIIVEDTGTCKFYFFRGSLSLKILITLSYSECPGQIGRSLSPNLSLSVSDARATPLHATQDISKWNTAATGCVFTIRHILINIPYIDKYLFELNIRAIQCWPFPEVHMQIRLPRYY